MGQLIHCFFGPQKGSSFIHQTHMHLKNIYYTNFAFCSCCQVGSLCELCNACILSSVAFLCSTSLVVTSSQLLAFAHTIFCKGTAPHVTQAFKHMLGNTASLKRCIWRQGRTSRVYGLGSYKMHDRNVNAQSLTDFTNLLALW